MKSALICLFIFCCSFGYCEDIKRTVEDLLEIFQSRQIEIIQQSPVRLSQRAKIFRFSLEKDHDYRIFIVTSGLLTEVDARLVLADDRAELPSKSSFRRISCINWSIPTFRRTKATLRLASRIGKRDAVVFLTTGGAQTEPGFVRTREVTTRGDVFEVQNGIVLRNGKIFFDKKRGFIVSICIAPNDDVFLRSDRGEVFRRKFLFYSVGRNRPPAVKLVTSVDDELFIFRADGTVTVNGRRLAFRGTKDKRGIDLIEQNGAVWVIRKDGKRIKLSRS